MTGFGLVNFVIFVIVSAALYLRKADESHFVEWIAVGALVVGLVYDAFSGG